MTTTDMLIINIAYSKACSLYKSGKVGNVPICKIQKQSLLYYVDHDGIQLAIMNANGTVCIINAEGINLLNKVFEDFVIKKQDVILVADAINKYKPAVSNKDVFLNTENTDCVEA